MIYHVPQGGVALGGNHQPLGAAVQPVADAGLEAVFAVGVVFTFFGQILGKGIHKVRVTSAVAVAQQVGGLVQHGHVVILINHGDFGLLRLFFGRSLRLGFCALRREKLIIDVQLDQVPGLQTVLRRGLFAVHLHPLVAETLVQKAGGKIAGHALHKARQAHAVALNILPGGLSSVPEMGTIKKER